MSESEKFFERMNTLIIGLCILFAFNFLCAVLGLGTDSTDQSGWNRSGMKLHTDHMTGCQYLSRGGITPRLDASGRQICEVTP